MHSKISTRKFFYVLLLLFVFLYSSPTSLFAEQEDVYQGLRPGDGRDIVFGNCTICHSASIILQHHMSREAWDKTITWMQQEQGMWELEPGDRKSILNYLSKYQGPDQNQYKIEKKRKNTMYEFYYPVNPL
ncbi:MAG: hypothetical protein NPINA01_08520 [Nitrospinaceae bacterium]|nr:MAG: hypothetical protein NPINA01_08520 [Nitrospinaceae bacterium]